MLPMAAKDEPTQSGGLKNSSKSHMHHIIPSLPPVVNSTKDLLHHYFHDVLFVLSPWNQHSTKLSLRKAASSSYPGNTVYRILLHYFQNRWHPFSEYHWKVNNNEFITFTKREYKDHLEKLINPSFHNHQYLLSGIIKCTTGFGVSLNDVGLNNNIKISLSEKVVKTASPNQEHVYGAGGCAVLSGFFKGRHTRKFAVTVAHLVNKIGDKLYTGKELLGYCRSKNDIMQIAQQKYMADLILIALDPNNRHAGNKLSVFEIEGKRYRPKLSSERQIHEIKPEAVVWIVDQYESLKIGKVFRHWYSNEVTGKAALRNVMQIMTADRKALTIAGDSGCCVCLPPKPNSDVIEVIGMVIGITEFYYRITCKNGVVLEFPNGTSCTNAVLLPIVLKHILRNLPPEQKKVGDFCEDEGLPANIDFSEGLDFCTSEESENLTVQSENSIGSIAVEGILHNSGAGL